MTRVVKLVLLAALLVAWVILLGSLSAAQQKQKQLGDNSIRIEWWLLVFQAISIALTAATEVGAVSSEAAELLYICIVSDGLSDACQLAAAPLDFKSATTAFALPLVALSDLVQQKMQWPPGSQLFCQQRLACSLHLHILSF